MCATCDKVNARLSQEKPLTADETKSFLNEIGEQMKKNKSADHFQNALDDILGTNMSESNEELDTAWENDRRRG